MLSSDLIASTVAGLLEGGAKAAAARVASGMETNPRRVRPKKGEPVHSTLPHSAPDLIANAPDWYVTLRGYYRSRRPELLQVVCELGPALLPRAKSAQHELRSGLAITVCASLCQTDRHAAALEFGYPLLRQSRDRELWAILQCVLGSAESVCNRPDIARRLLAEVMSEFPQMQMAFGNRLSNESRHRNTRGCVEALSDLVVRFPDAINPLTDLGKFLDCDSSLAYLRTLASFGEFLPNHRPAGLGERVLTTWNSTPELRMAARLAIGTLLVGLVWAGVANADIMP